MDISETDECFVCHLDQARPKSVGFELCRDNWPRGDQASRFRDGKGGVVSGKQRMGLCRYVLSHRIEEVKTNWEKECRRYGRNE